MLVLGVIALALGLAVQQRRLGLLRRLDVIQPVLHGQLHLLDARHPAVRRVLLRRLAHFQVVRDRVQVLLQLLQIRATRILLRPLLTLRSQPPPLAQLLLYVLHPATEQ
jgi:hypothetical protein